MSENNTVVYINWDGFAKYYLDYALENNYKVPTLEAVIKEGVLFENAYTSIPSITNAMQPTIVSGTTPKYTDNHFRYFNKDKNRVIQEEPRRVNRAETIAESLGRQNLEILSINQFALEDRGTYPQDKKRLYISIPGKNGMKRFEFASQFIKNLNAGGYQFEKMPRFIALYMDELDDLGHNFNEIHRIPVADSEEERIKRVMSGLEVLDLKLGEFLESIKDKGIYEKFTFILTADHGMTTTSKFQLNGRAGGSMMKKVVEDLESLSYKVEVLKENEKPKYHDTDIILVTVGLQLHLSYPHLHDLKDIDKRNKKIIGQLKIKEYFGQHKDIFELLERGVKRGFADLLISPKVPYNFKPDEEENNYIAKGQHDSLDITSQNIPLIMWGNKIRENKKIQDRVYVTSVAPMVSLLLEKNLPLDATSEILYPALLMDKFETFTSQKNYTGKHIVDKDSHRFDLEYSSKEDQVFAFYLNNEFVRDVFFPETDGEFEKKRINISLKTEDEIQFRNIKTDARFLRFGSIVFHHLKK